MKRFFHMIFPLLSAALLVTGCKSQFEALLASGDVDAKYDAAWKFYNTAKYKKAAQMFESLSMLTSGTEKDDTVRFYWALSNYNYKDYVTADANFGSFIELYPSSPFSPEARFLKIDCMYRSTYRYELDQAPTNAAIMAISEYILDYPTAERVSVCRQMLQDLTKRLNTKEFEAAKLYYKMEDYIASKTAFKNILKDNSNTTYREDVLYYIAMSAYKYAYLSVPAKQKERYMEFMDEYLNFVSEVPDSKYRKELDNLHEKAQKFI